MPHRQAVGVDGVQLLFEVFDVPRVRLALDVDERHVGLRHLADALVDHAQLRCANAAAEQRRVEDERLDEAVPRAAHHAVALRLGDTAHRVGACVNQHRVRAEGLAERGDPARQHQRGRRVEVLGDVHLDIGYAAVGKPHRRVFAARQTVEA